jgi:hypothetical protein
MEKISDARHNLNSIYTAGAIQLTGAEREDIHLALLKQEMYRLISLGEGRELILQSRQQKLSVSRVDE